jgi:hypothetical protein
MGTGVQVEARVGIGVQVVGARVELEGGASRVAVGTLIVGRARIGMGDSLDVGAVAGVAVMTRRPGEMVLRMATARTSKPQAVGMASRAMAAML